MALHPQIPRIVANLPHPSLPLDPVAMRAAEQTQVLPPAERQPIRSVADDVVAGVPVRVYADAATSPTGEQPGTLVYLHGGAFFLGSLDTHDHVCRALAGATGLTVFSVGYRLAPEHPFPAGLDDCYAVVEELAAGHAPGRPLALAGDSSGGAFVAAVAGRAADAGLGALTHQVLYYPSLDLRIEESIETGRYPSLAENAVGYGLETAGIVPFNAFYLRDADPTDPRVSPLLREDLTGLPPALIVTAEHDPMRDEGELYGQRLRSAGVPVTVSRYPGAGHGFVQHFSWIPEYHRVFAETAEFLA